MALTFGIDSASVLVDDNFNDNSLDAAKWTTVTTFLHPKNVVKKASVKETGQRIELHNRGWLVTKEEFDPAALGGIRVTGSLKFNDTGDNFKIMIRSDGAPNPDNKYGEAKEGKNARNFRT